jgi:hypothetical protein
VLWDIIAEPASEVSRLSEAKEVLWDIIAEPASEECRIS